MARLGRVCGVSWVRPGMLEDVSEASWTNFGASWSHLKGSWEDFGRVWGSFGGFLEAFWEHFLKIFCHLEQNVKMAKNMGKPMFFIDFGGSRRVLGLGKQ